MGNRFPGKPWPLLLLSWQLFRAAAGLCADARISPELRALCFKNAISSLASPTAQQPRAQYIRGLYESIPVTPVTEAGDLVLRATREEAVGAITMNTQILLRPTKGGAPAFHRKGWASFYQSYLNTLEQETGDFFDLPEKKALKRAIQLLTKPTFPPGEALLRKQALAFLLLKKMETDPTLFQLQSGSQGWKAIEEALTAMRRDPKLLFPEIPNMPETISRQVRALLPDPETVKNPASGVFLAPEHSKKVGAMYEIYFKDRNQIALEYGALDYTPSPPVSFINVPGTVPMIPGRGTPTLTFAALQQMRMLGIPTGGLKTAFGRIVSVRTGLELRQIPEIAQWLKTHPGQPVPNEMIGRHLLSTQIGRFTENVLTQSGHRIKTVNVYSNSNEALGNTVSHWNLDPSTQSLFLSPDAKGAPEPLPLDTLIPQGFLFDMDLEPIK